MSQLRGSAQVWNNQTVLNNGVTSTVYVAGGPYVAVYIENASGASATFKVQAAAPANTGAGLNVLPDFWFDYQGATSVVVAAGAAVCVDLAPFAPSYLRLMNVTGSTSANISAYISSNGPD